MNNCPFCGGKLQMFPDGSGAKCENGDFVTNVEEDYPNK